jgi:hypothetical protein
VIRCSGSRLTAMALAQVQRTCTSIFFRPSLRVQLCSLLAAANSCPKASDLPEGAHQVPIRGALVDSKG